MNDFDERVRMAARRHAEFWIDAGRRATWHDPTGHGAATWVMSVRAEEERAMAAAFIAAGLDQILTR